MPSKKDCIDDIVAKTGRNRKQVEDDLAELLDEADRHRQGGESPRDALGRGAEELLKKYATDASRRRRAAMMDADLFNDASRWYREQYKAGVRPDVLLKAELDGSNRQFYGSSESAGAMHGTYQKKYVVSFGVALERAGLDRLFASRAVERNVLLELEQLNKRRGGTPGLTQDKQALEIARTYQGFQKLTVANLNRRGAWVGDLSGYVTRQEHDANLIRRGGLSAPAGLSAEDAQARWTNAVLQHADLGRSFGPNDARAVLKDMYDPMKRGKFYDAAMAGEPSPNLAAQASAHREIHWKSVDDWMAYNKEFGPRTPTQAMVYALDAAARRMALMTKFGTKPREGFEARVDVIENSLLKKDDAARKQFQDALPYLRNIYDQLDHSANKPANELWSKVVAWTLALNRWSMLPRVLWAHVASLPTRFLAGRAVGMSFAERHGNQIAGMFRGAADSDKREIADIALAGSAARMGRMLVSHDVSDASPGIISTIDHYFFKLTGVSSATDNQRTVHEVMVARTLARERGKAWADLADEKRNLLQSWKIGEPEWKALHATPWTDVGDKTYLTPVDARNIPDAAIQTMLNETAQARGARPALASPDAIGKAREDLSDRLQGLLYEEGRRAIFTSGSATTRARLFFGTQTKAPNMYKAIQLLAQFRVWPAEMIGKSWGRIIYGDYPTQSKIMMAAEFAAAGALYGTFSNSMSQITQGRDPIAQLKEHPFKALLAGALRSGVGTIMGDYLLGEYDRHGQSISESALGPTYGQVGRIIDLRNDIQQGAQKGDWKQFWADLLYDAKGHLPVDMWWTFKAFDYLVTYNLMEAIRPGFLNRMEQRMKDKSGIQFWLKPSRVHQVGLPAALKEAVGGN